MKKKAFTLIELLIYLSIAIMILSTILSFSLNTLQQQRTHIADNELLGSGQLIMHEIEKQIRNADSVDENNSVLNASPGLLSLISSNPDTNPTVIRISNNSLFLIQGAHDPISLSKNQTTVEQLIFRILSTSQAPEVIQVNLTLKSGTETKTFQSSYTIKQW